MSAQDNDDDYNNGGGDMMLMMMMVLCHDGAKPNSILGVAVVVIVGCRRQSGEGLLCGHARLFEDVLHIICQLFEPIYNQTFTVYVHIHSNAHTAYRIVSFRICLCSQRQKPWRTNVVIIVVVVSVRRHVHTMMRCVCCLLLMCCWCYDVAKWYGICRRRGRPHSPP